MATDRQQDTANWPDASVWGDASIWGPDAPDFIAEDAIGHLTVSAEYPSDPPIHVWTGIDDLMLGGVTYAGIGPDVVDIRIGKSSEKEDARLQVTLARINTPELRRAFQEFSGRVVVTVRFVYSEDGGNTWLSVPRFFRGLYSRPTLRNDTATYRENLDRGYEQNWSDSSQQAEYPGDRGFEHLLRIAEGADLTIRWPP